MSFIPGEPQPPRDFFECSSQLIPFKHLTAPSQKLIKYSQTAFFCPTCQRESKLIDALFFRDEINIPFYTKITLLFKCTKDSCKHPVPLMVVRDFSYLGKTYEHLPIKQGAWDHLTKNQDVIQPN